MSKLCPTCEKITIFEVCFECLKCKTKRKEKNKEKEPEKQDLQKIISAINWVVIDGGENGKVLARHILWLENELKKAREK